MLKRNLVDGMGIVYIIVDSEFNVIRERFEKRGDDIVEDVEELKSEFDSWNEYYNDSSFLNDNIKVKKVKDWKECISYLNWLENNVSDNRSFKFGRKNSEMEKKYNEYDRWSKLKRNELFDFEILEEDYKSENKNKILFY